MTNEKVPEQVWLTVFSDDKEPHFTMLEWQSPVVRNTQPGDYVATRPHHKVEYVPADLLATVRGEERKAAFKDAAGIASDFRRLDQDTLWTRYKTLTLEAALLEAENRKKEG